MHEPEPLISVVILNYNGSRWIERCLESVKAQTIISQGETIVADNASTDGSDLLAERLLARWPNGLFIQHGANLGFCAGNNRAALQARGRYLLFLNNDTWLEPDCLEKLVAGVETAGASGGCPLVLNYHDHSFQSMGAFGFDIFGLPSTRDQRSEPLEVLMPEGCAYLIRRDVFTKLGGFDEVFFMFSDELDLSWRAWLSGHRLVAVPAARMHHRGAAQVNPAGELQPTEFRTSDTKRFYANRNALLVLLKNGRWVVLGMALLQLVLLGAEAIAALLLVRRWNFIRRAYVEAVADCWRLRGHIAERRREIAGVRKRGDVWMLRFLKARLNRWDEVQRIRREGVPKVTAG